MSFAAQYQEYRQQKQRAVKGLNGRPLKFRLNVAQINF
jgi:hypothetical protein